MKHYRTTNKATIIAIHPYPGERSPLFAVIVTMTVMLLIWLFATWLEPAKPDCPAMVTPVLNSNK